MLAEMSTKWHYLPTSQERVYWCASPVELQNEVEMPEDDATSDDPFVGRSDEELQAIIDAARARLVERGDLDPDGVMTDEEVLRHLIHNPEATLPSLRGPNGEPFDPAILDGVEALLHADRHLDDSVFTPPGSETLDPPVT
jgi:hypothetical protein